MSRSRTPGVSRPKFPAFVNGHDDLLIETLAGLLDNASPEQRIRAETEEETGFRVRAVRKVFVRRPSTRRSPPRNAPGGA